MKRIAVVVVLLMLGGMGVVSAAGDAPVAVDDSYILWREMAEPWIVPPGILKNDFDPGGLPLTAELMNGPSHGELRDFDTHGRFLYWPDQWFLGEDTFTYRAYNGYEYSEPASVTIQMVPYAPPDARKDAYEVPVDTTLNVPAPGILANDNNWLWGPPFTMYVVLIQNPEHGSLDLNSDGSFVYTPAAGFIGTDNFWYIAVPDYFDNFFSEYTQVTITVSDPGGTPVPEFPGMPVVICGLILGGVFVAARMGMRRDR